ncbi:hypothetical protein ASPZODRAFT_71096 [Penicilliopsis zonata CBS 506.65]|uniref:Epoxide hydrolase N-terminal domain-containing protein n=1 Tax=Penicilliopsis zonata CBS 506.65 TaxID=1073090 RepID=A0A1L9SBY7_9EURO|nr:hypothetical protein ASPZODRAFT_71096 [Penicilliopsis zonata CBS 506.65]OJJ44691.1 hypothetical protein ASPZODRAFT_71096 [Penicilliopsis zonata CBS 506.65]
MAAFKPFQISVSESQLKLLKRKLDEATFPDELDHAGWDMGVPLDEMKRLVKVWREDFDWRDQERKLNEQLAQFTTSVPVSGFGELDLHFVHEKSPTPGAIPLLFIHGWPGSFLEAKKLVPLLTRAQNENQPAFHVVAPSLPNYGFSEGVIKRGFGLAQYAEALDSLMTSLGYEEYVTQGGDWGSMLSRVLAKHYPEHVKAIHLNFAPVLPWNISPLSFVRSLLTIPFSAKERAKLATSWSFTAEGNGYMRQQETFPQTLGYALQDSPVALLAWILDKLHVWSDVYPWTDEEILTWVSIYQFSRAGPTASTRIYYEAQHNPGDGRRFVSIADSFSICAPKSVKIAIAETRKEIIVLPLAWYRMIGNLARHTELGIGGHFAAWEVPELLAQDLQSFFGREGQAFASVTARDGY